MKSLVNASRLRNCTNDQDIRTQYPEDGIGQLFGDENETESEDDENNEPDDQRDQLYKVEKLLRMRKRAGKRHFYVKWEDGSKTWEPEENLSDDLIREYFVTHMKKMAEAAKNDEKVFQTLTEPLLSGDIELESSWFDTRTIITYVGFIMTILALLGCVYLFLKIRKLSAMLMVLQQAHLVKSVDPNFVFKKPSTEAPINILEVIQEHLKWDHLIFAMTFLIVGMIIVFAIAFYNYNIKETTIMLEITSGKTCAIIPLLSVPLCPSVLDIKPPSSITDITLAKLPYCKLIADWKNFTVTNKLQNSTIEVPTTIKISLINRVRVAKIMKQPYMAYILLRHGRITMPIPNFSEQKYFDYFKN